MSKSNHSLHTLGPVVAGLPIEASSAVSAQANPPSTDIDSSLVAASGIATVNTTVVGGAGNDTLRGGDGNDLLQGNEGNDALYGGAGNDTFYGGQGNDLLVGGKGNDTFMFSRTSGKDTIDAFDDTVGKLDVIELTSSLAPADVVLVRDGESLVLTVKGRSDSLRVADYFKGDAAAGYQVEQIKFSNGAIWDVDFVKAKLLEGTAGNDMLIGYGSNDSLFGLNGNDLVRGGAGDDLLDGGEGDDVLFGGEGNDTIWGEMGDDLLIGGEGNDYLGGDQGHDTLDGGAGDDTLEGRSRENVFIFGKGYGHDVIKTIVPIGDGTIQLGAGIKPGDVTLRKEWSTSNRITLTLNETGDTLQFNGHLDLDWDTVGQIQFADGTVWNTDQIRAQALAGTEGNDILYGWGSELIQGLGGDDLLDGGDGNDTLDGGSGNDTLVGGNGRDTFIFNRGSGQDRIQEGFTYQRQSDVIQLGADITPDNVSVSLVEYDLFLVLKGTADRLVTYGYFGGTGSDGGPLRGREYVDIQFADGTQWDLDEVYRRSTTDTRGDERITGTNDADLLLGLAGNDTLDGQGGDDSLYSGAGHDLIMGGVGNDSIISGEGDDLLNGDDGDDFLTGEGGNDTLNGGAGNDALNGGAGDDIYLFGRGAGNDIIDPSYTYTAGHDVIQLGANVQATDISFQRNWRDLSLSIRGTSDSLTVSSYFSQTADTEMKISFADGSTWAVSDVFNQLPGGTSGNDTLDGTNFSDMISGLDGDDLIDGSFGDDVLAGDAGQDSLVGRWGNDSLDGGTGNDSLDGGDGDDLLNGGAGDDSLYGEEGNDIFNGGAGNDTLKGDEGNDVLDGGAGNDLLRCGLGDDTILFGRGSGQDGVDAWDSGIGRQDVVQLASGVAPGDISLRHDEVGSLLIGINGTTDRLAIYDYFFGDDYKIQQIRFADGTAWYGADIDQRLGGNAGVMQADRPLGFDAEPSALATQADGLIGAMAAFAPAASISSTLGVRDPSYSMPVLAANWS